ncbi:MAG: hydrolase [Burkholderiales bacterium RIFCSPLOWO2_12_FULL_65_40]|nr:MAG: hydrolase [Burkholderiales bacterium RIFCSPLOWO2_12_FULL_65_40]
MDSISQAALGSAVVLATLGRRTAAWKAALWGAAAGTLPDLDAFIDHGDPLLNMVRHRAESHGLVLLALASAPLGWLAARLTGQPDLWRRWWLAMALALVTHPLLDTLTVYGTQLLQPFSNHPFAVGSVFIIDPLYTLPLLAGVLAALLWPFTKGLRWNAAMLALSTAYLGWSVLAQQHVRGVLDASLRQNGMAASQMLVTPAPFSTVLWRAVAMGPEHYHEAYYSLLDGAHPVTWNSHPRGADLRAQHADNPHVQRLAWFSHGFMRMQASSQGRLTITDLRMGLEPCYSFHFDIGPAQPQVGETVQVLQQWQRPDLSVALPWWWRRLTDPSAGTLSALPGGAGCGTTP